MFSLFKVCIFRTQCDFHCDWGWFHSLTESVAAFPASVCCGIRTIVSVSRLADHYVRRKLLCELTNDEACNIITVDTTITAPLCCSATAWLVRNRATTAEKQTGSTSAPAEPFSRSQANFNKLVFTKQIILRTSLQFSIISPKIIFLILFKVSSIVLPKQKTYTKKGFFE